jgi:Zn-dependent protease/predicted transcriptional regulator
VWQTGTIRVARIGGIAVEIHFTFIAVIFWGAWQGWYQYGGITGIGYGILLTLLLFGSILLHELGHGLQARSFGLVVRRIILLPIGGIAQLETPPAYPWQELVVALAGPMVNFGLAMIFALIAYVLAPFSLRGWVEYILQMFLSPPSLTGLTLYMVGANLLLFVFNMLPAFPMDGGRVLRAALALAFNYELATRISSWLGRILAAGMALLGLIGWPPARIPPNPLLLIVGAMIFFGAQQEEIYVRRQRALVRVEVHELAQRGTPPLAPWDTITQGLAARLFRHDQTLPVVVEERVVGVLTYHDVRRAYRHLRQTPLTVAHVMRTYFPVLRLSDTLWVALQEMNTYQLAAIPIVENGVYQGIVRLDDINHAWRFAVRRRRTPSTLASGDSVIYD